jgi:4-amino-4-deoxy-L-arabinose transferase-like glycosyltransferase
MKGAIAPAILVVAAYLIIHQVIKRPALWSLYQGLVILLLLPVAYFGTKLLYKKGQIKVLLPGEKL